jgi:hypothetical protein
MKKMIATILLVLGLILTIWAGMHILGTKKLIMGYDPMYPGLLGIALLSFGAITRGE